MSAPTSQIPGEDLWRFAEGTHDGLAYLLGAHLDESGSCTFRVWAPNAARVHVIGDFNGWDHSSHSLWPSDSGIWSGRIDGVEVGQSYKFAVTDRAGNTVDKADPFAFAAEEPPGTASKIWRLDYRWDDAEWMARRGQVNAHDRPISIYELHLGSWRYEPGGYRAIAHQLADYLDQTGFTHVELMPVMEHPFYGSWGYQTTGYFAATSRYGQPQDLMYLIDHLHQRGYGVLLDWVPSHFPTDAHGLARFDGTHLFEHADPRLGFHPDWQSAIFNYDRHEVRSFLLSSARFWIERYHADGLRVDAVASMLYRDYSRKAGEWIPNDYGGRENLGAISFLQEMNRRIYLHHPDTLTVAEESTAWPGVSKPTDSGGLGFGFKWDMGWMHDTLEYIQHDPVHRRWHHGELTFRLVYAFSENFVLPLSHDEVVHGKGSLLERQPGDRWQKLAGLRALYGYQWASPGKKLLFMGGEFAVPGEWSHEEELPWALLGDHGHGGVQAWVSALNGLYRSQPALYEVDSEPEGFQWIVGDDADNSVLVFARHGSPGSSPVVVAINFTPVPRPGYRFGVPGAGSWVELLNSDDHRFGGSGVINEGTFSAEQIGTHGLEQSIQLTLPPLGVVFLGPAD
ncbi:MAG: 1,4-alpha-glucan branching protein GlgB [Acidimicrobiales bacterium]|nr:1,4-alpha-glucan branching protein GlgB [Acidimicrobiales bacterium]